MEATPFRRSGLLHKGSRIAQSLFLYAAFILPNDTFSKWAMWFLTSDLLLVREVYYVCQCSWLFKNYLQIDQMYT
jgi:hypothetical protein